MPSQAAQFCQNLLLNIGEIDPTNNAQIKDRKAGFLQSLLSPINTVGFTRPPGKQSANGHYVSWDVWYRKRATAADVAEEITCDPGTLQDKSSVTVESPFQAQVTTQFRFDDIARFCQESSQMERLGNKPGGAMKEIVDGVMATFSALREKIDRILLAQVLNYAREAVSPYNVGFTALDLIRTSADGAPIQAAWQTMRRNAENNEMGFPLITVGQGYIQDFVSGMKFGCCNQYGADFMKMNEDGMLAFFYDPNTNEELGDNNFIQYEPGALQFLWLNLNEGNMAGEFDGSFFFTIPDPLVPGLLYDAVYEVDKCGAGGRPVVNLRLESRFGLFGRPDDAFKDSDPLYQFQGVIGYTGQEAA